MNDQATIFFTFAAYICVPSEFVMFKKILNGFIDHPVLTSIFVVDFGILLFHRPPFFFSLAMFTALIAMCMYLGQKLSLFKA